MKNNASFLDSSQFSYSKAKRYVGERYSALLRIPGFHLTDNESLNAEKMNEEALKKRPVKAKLSILKTNTEYKRFVFRVFQVRIFLHLD